LNTKSSGKIERFIRQRKSFDQTKNDLHGG